ncbi:MULTISPECIES: hypothetical protein [unclassified Arthrobacter]|uniref:aggregation-promoting factor C-terminal-like domain-containing protein n=1 Tax=unclassified Arthrobacter TaxID=235627 RepID=UPI002F3E522B
MGPKLRRSPLFAVVFAGILASAVLTAGPVSAADPYPSWEDIQQAKSSEAAKASEADKLEGLLTELRTDAGQLGDAAVKATSRYNAARDALAENEKLLASLSAQREAAEAQADETLQRVAALAAQTYKSGGAAADGLGLLLLDTEASADALHGADLMDRVSSRAGTLYAAATASERVAAGLADQEQQARDARADLLAEAKRYLDEAGASATAADEAVREEEARKTVLLAQLADLHGTTADVENARLRGIAAEQAFQEQQAAAERAARNAGTVTRPAVGSPVAPGAPETGVPAVTLPIAPVPAPAPAPAPAPGPAPVPLPPPPAQPVDDPAGAQNYAAGMMGAYGWDGNEFRCLVSLWNRESNWRTSAANPSSGAYGIPQSLPGSKMASHGSDWQTNYRTQINWGLEYISWRYGTPCGAWQHSEEVNWY